MLKSERAYIAIDLKSFYASVECVERGFDPLTTHLVVADKERTQKTICLAVSPSLKAYGIPGRARLFEVVQKVREANKERIRKVPGKQFTGSSYFEKELLEHPEYELDYIAAPPRMALYLDYSTRIYRVYLRHFAPEDIHVYSIDEVLIDATQYLKVAGKTPRELASQIIREIYEDTRVTATGGIGSNLYLCKVALDILSKHAKPDENGIRIAQLDERSYREKLWTHKPLTDFWRVGPGYARKLAENGLFTMGDIARCSIGKEDAYYNEDLLYRLFGVNAELLIDHAWGWEPCTMAHIKAYKPSVNCLSSGQVLQEPYEFDDARIIVREMTDLLVLDLVEKKLVTDQLVLTIGYDVENLIDPVRSSAYHGEVTTDQYGRQVPKHAHGTIRFDKPTSSTREIVKGAMELYDRIVNRMLLVRRINVTVGHLLEEENETVAGSFEQLSLFDLGGETKEDEEGRSVQLEKERRLQEAMLQVKKKYGKNAILKGTNLQEKATTILRNNQIGGHKA